MAEYIEKGALMSLIESEAHRWGDDYDWWQCLADIEDFKPADVRPVVRGHDTGKSRWFRCSVCDYGVNDLFEACENGMPSCYERKGDTGWNFCPNCGADMREAEP